MPHASCAIRPPHSGVRARGAGVGPGPGRPGRRALAIAVLALGFGSSAYADEVACRGLTGAALAASELALPSGGAVVTDAEYARAGGGQPYCKVLGRVRPVDPTAPPVLFQVNLPEQWNSKALQYGGGGLNGALVTGLQPLRDAPPGPTPLERGYVTLGTDGGHPAAPEIQVFALNDEALVNHAYGAYKKTHDVAASLIRRYYGRPPEHVYFFGGSEGGREAMLSAQRFPADYDGIVAAVPLIRWAGLQLPTYQHHRLQEAGGWMGQAKLDLVETASVAACDARDGRADGVIARYEGCAAEADAALARLRCPAGADTGETCLSDAQIALVRAVRAPYRYGFSLPHGEAAYPGFPIGGEGQPNGYVASIVPRTPTPPGDRAAGRVAVGDVRYFFMRDPEFSGAFDARRHRARIAEISRLMDNMNPDLRAFQRRGGKLIMKENGADYTIAPASVFEYYRTVVSTMGQGAVDRFLRLYVAPGANHGGQGRSATTGQSIPDRVDLLAALEAWVEQGREPGPLVLTRYSQDATPAPLAAWPLCRYPNYPHYVGNGDPGAAASYRCTPLARP